MKGGKNMRGFMCQSPSSTAVCMTGDPRSVIVPRRHSRSSSGGMVDHSMLMNTKYSRLAEPRGRFSSSGINNYRNVTLSSVLNQDRHRQRQRIMASHAHIAPPPPLITSSSSDHAFQVVVMRVSLHCQGCAGKVKKHLSKMEGVTSFSIELETKRVTVMGHVSPVGVLESISKVKRAEFWPC